MQKPSIRKATSHDLTELVELFDQYRIFYRKGSDIDGARKFLGARLVNDESTVFVCHKGTVMTGFTQLYPIFSSTRMKKYWLLNDLFVAPGFRGEGISVALLEYAKAWCVESGACGFMLETAKTNTIGNQLYQKVGLVLDVEHNVYSWDVA